MSKSKPLLGTVPYYIVSGDRVKNLSEAIIRYSEYIDNEYELIQQWAEEIIMHCNICKKFDKEK